jgi:hypothetical protein
MSGGRAKVQARSAPGIARQAAAPAKVPTVVGRDESETLQKALAVLDSIKQVGSNEYEVMLDGQLRRLTQADVDAAFAKTKAALRSSLTSIRIKAEGAIEGYKAQSDVDEEHPIVSRAVKFFGGIDDPGDEIRGLAAQAFNLIVVSQVQLEQNHFANAGRLMALAETLAKRAEKTYHAYHEDIISTAESTVTVLEYTQTAAFVTLAVLATVATAGAAAGVTSVAGVELGAASTANAIAIWTPVAAKLGQAGVKIAYGEKVDWKELAVDVVVTAVVAKFAPQLSEGIAARIIGSNPVAASLGRKAVASIVSGLITGRGSAAFGAAAHVACARAEGKDVTWGTLVDQTADAVLDPKSAGLDLVLGAIGTAGAVKGGAKVGVAEHDVAPPPHETPVPGPKRARQKPGPVTKQPAHSEPLKPAMKAPAPETKAPVHDTPAAIAKPTAKPHAEATAPKAADPVTPKTDTPPAPAPKKTPDAAAPKGPAPKGPIVEETRIKPTVIRRRRGPADPNAPVAEKKPAAPETKPLTSAQRKTGMAAEARDEMRAHGEHERENASPENVPKDIDDVRERPNLREDEMHSPTHPEILGAALERAGMPRLPGHDPHHMVPTSGGGAAGDRARAVLERAGIHGDDADNGVWLPRTTIDPRTIPQPAPIDPRIAPEGLSRHQTIHTGRYYEEIAARLEAAEGKRSVRDTLRDIRAEIAEGKFPH